MNQHVAVVSGATSGIGYATAARFATAGWKVILLGRNKEKLAAAQRKIELSNPGAQCRAIQVDFRLPDSVIPAARNARDLFQRIDSLVNAAAVAFRAPFENITSDQLEETINVNQRSLFHLTQAIWPTMKEQGRGTIINVSSMAALSPFTGFSVYGSSKAWLDLFTRALADEGRSCGIRAFSVRPGAVETAMLRRLFPDFPAEQTVSPENVAEVIWQLCQPAWQYSSGEAFNVSRQV